MSADTGSQAVGFTTVNTCHNMSGHRCEGHCFVLIIIFVCYYTVSTVIVPVNQFVKFVCILSVCLVITIYLVNPEYMLERKRFSN